MTANAETAPRTARDVDRRRLAAALGAASVVTVDLGAKAWAASSLQDRVIGVGPLDLRLGYNPGVAFSLGAGAPGWVVLAVTASITVAVAVVGWRMAPAASRMRLAALTLILGGASANVLDRLSDGVVTDYLHTGWWPTFNLADVAIVTGAVLVALSAFCEPASDWSG